MNVTPFVVLGGVVGMVMGTPADEDTTRRADRLMITSTHQLAAAPEPSANCLLKNAPSAGAPASQIHPLYGMTRVAVVMRQHATGDTLAVATLEPAEPGANVRIDTTPHVENRETLVAQLLKGC